MGPGVVVADASVVAGAASVVVGADVDVGGGAVVVVGAVVEAGAVVVAGGGTVVSGAVVVGRATVVAAAGAPGTATPGDGSVPQAVSSTAVTTGRVARRRRRIPTAWPIGRRNTRRVAKVVVRRS